MANYTVTWGGVTSLRSEKLKLFLGNGTFTVILGNNDEVLVPGAAEGVVNVYTVPERTYYLQQNFHEATVFRVSLGARVFSPGNK